jgi:hypothetical protein
MGRVYHLRHGNVKIADCRCQIGYVAQTEYTAHLLSQTIVMECWYRVVIRYSCTLTKGT